MRSVPRQPTTLGCDVGDDVPRPISDARTLLFPRNRLTRGGVRAKSANSPQFSSDGGRIPRVTGSELWDGASGRLVVSRSLDVINPSIRRYRTAPGRHDGSIVSAMARRGNAQWEVVRPAAVAANCGILSNRLFRRLSHGPRISCTDVSGESRAAAAASNSCWKGVARRSVPTPSEIARTWQMPTPGRAKVRTSTTFVPPCFWLGAFSTA